MGVNFRDLQAASRMRDIIERMTISIINKERPGERIGRVYRADRANQFAWILFPGESEDNLVKVRVSKNLHPTKTVETDGLDECDIVRIAGRPGAYYISDMIRGIGAVGIPVGTMLPFSGTTSPASFFLCDGSELLRVDEPELFAVIGTTYGVGDGDTTFNLPDMRGRFLYGLNPGSATGSHNTLGGNEGSDLSGRDDRLNHVHSHVISPEASGSTWLVPNTGSNSSPRASAFDGHSHGGATGSKGLNDQNLQAHAFLTVNFIIKA